MNAPLKERLIARALEEGFTEARMTHPRAVPEMPTRLDAFLSAGYHGQMGWLADRTEWRANPAALWPEARSILMLSESYTPEDDPLAGLAEKSRGLISAYARGKDYHDLVKRRLKRLGRWLIDEAKRQGDPCEIKVFVDTAPVPEKALAEAAGLGWQGKHTNLVSRTAGNWVFLGALFTTLDFTPDPPEDNHCGTCSRCLDICPTQAFTAPYRMDARSCISYLTIEHKGPIAEDLRPLLGNHIYGCDDCLAVCPWNKFAQAPFDPGYTPRDGTVLPPLAELARLSDDAFRIRFAGSPIKRIGRNRFVRNVLYAIGNSADPRLRPAAEALTTDPDETVADAAEWAVKRLIHAANGQDEQR